MTKHTYQTYFVHIVRFLNYVWPFFNIMHESVNEFLNGWIVRLNANPVNIYLFKVTIETVKNGVKYVQS